jgi:conjugal transfer pilus assembly protein TraB
MNSSSVPDAGSVVRRRNLWMFGGGLGFFVVLVFLMWASDSSKPKADSPTPMAPAKTEQVEAASRKLSDAELWTAKADADLQTMRKANEAVLQQMEQVKRQNEELGKQVHDQQEAMKGVQDAQAKAATPPAAPAGAVPALDAIVPPLAGADGKPVALPPPPNGTGVDGNSAALPPPMPPEPEDDGIVHIVVDGADGSADLVATVGTAGAGGAPGATGGQGAPGNNTPKVDIQQPPAQPVQPLVGTNGNPLPQKRDRPKAKTYIPSGSFFKAQLLASLDAPTGGNAESNPHPVLLMVTDNAFLPNRFRSKVKECRVLASGYGDLSSERVSLRTEKLSCVLSDGTVVDTKLDGYIAGEDGKEGLRGNLVSKQGSMIANSLLAGTLGGIGQGLAQAATTVTNTGSGTVSSVQPNQVLGFGVESGAGGAMQKLADYYLKAAEKTFPILEVSAGRDVTVVLLSGLDIEADPGMAAGQGLLGNNPLVTATDRKQAGLTLRDGDTGNGEGAE